MKQADAILTLALVVQSLAFKLQETNPKVEINSLIEITHQIVISLEDDDAST